MSGESPVFTSAELDILKASFTAMDQTYGLTLPGFNLQPIDNSGQGQQQPWVTPSGWAITDSIEGIGFGGKFVIYKNEITNQVMLVSMGTNGSSDITGWTQNILEYGYSQWAGDVTSDGRAVQAVVYSALNRAMENGAEVIFAGDSKGDALSQFIVKSIIDARDAGYFISYDMDNLQTLENGRIYLIGRNGPGTEAYNQQNDPNFDANSEKYNGINAYYFCARSEDGTKTEVVGQVGGNHLADKGLCYYFQEGVDAPSDPFGAITYLHRLTEAFYDFASAVGGDFTKVSLQPRELMSVSQLVAVGAFFGSIGLEGKIYNTVEAYARIGTTAICGLAMSPASALAGAFKGEFGVQTITGLLTYAALSTPLGQALLAGACATGVVLENGAKFLGDSDMAATISNADLWSAVNMTGAPTNVPPFTVRFFGYTQTGGRYVIDVPNDNTGAIVYCVENGLRTVANIGDANVDIGIYNPDGSVQQVGLVECRDDSIKIKTQDEDGYLIVTEIKDITTADGKGYFETSQTRIDPETDNVVSSEYEYGGIFSETTSDSNSDGEAESHTIETSDGRVFDLTSLAQRQDAEYFMNSLYQWGTLSTPLGLFYESDSELSFRANYTGPIGLPFVRGFLAEPDWGFLR